MRLLKRLKNMCLWSLLVGLLLTPGRSILAQEDPPSTVTREQLTESLPTCDEAVGGLTRLFAILEYKLIPENNTPGRFQVFYAPRRFQAGRAFYLIFLPVPSPPPDPEEGFLLEKFGRCETPQGIWAAYYLYGARPRPTRREPMDLRN